MAVLRLPVVEVATLCGSAMSFQKIVFMLRNCKFAKKFRQSGMKVEIVIYTAMPVRNGTLTKQTLLKWGYFEWI